MNPVCSATVALLRRCHRRWRKVAWRFGALALLAATHGAGAAQSAQDAGYEQALAALAAGDFALAERLLMEVAAANPLHAGAALDLALLACAQGDEARALRLFDWIAREHQPPPAVQALMAQRRLQGCRDTGVGAWRGWLRAGGGWDSNANQGAAQPQVVLGTGEQVLTLELAPNHRPQAATFSDVGAEFSRGLPWPGWQLALGAAARRTDGLATLNQDWAHVRLQYVAQGEAGGVRLAGVWGALTLGGQTGAVFRQLELEWLQSPAAGSWQRGLDLGVAWLRYPQQPDYDARTVDAALRWRWSGPGQVWDVKAGTRWDMGGALRPGGDRRGVFAGVQYGHALAEGWQLQVDWALSAWRSQAPFAPGLLEERRAPRLQTLRWVLQHDVSPRQSVWAELRHSRQTDSVGFFAFGGRALTLGLQWNF